MVVPWSPLFSFLLLSSRSSFSSLFLKTLSVQIVPIPLRPHCYTRKQSSPVQLISCLQKCTYYSRHWGSKTYRFLPQGAEGERSQVNKLISGSDEGHEANIQDRMDEASTSDRAMPEGFSEPPFMPRLRQWGSSHRNIREKGLSQGKAARPWKLAPSIQKSGGSLWLKYSQEENKLEWKRQAGPTHIKSVEREAAGVWQKNTRPDWPSLWLFRPSTGLWRHHTHDPFMSLLSLLCSWNHWTILLTLGSLHFMSIYPSILCHLPVTTATETAFSEATQELLPSKPLHTPSDRWSFLELL